MDYDCQNIVTFSGTSKRGPASTDALFTDISKYLDDVNGIVLDRLVCGENNNVYVYYHDGDTICMSRGKWRNEGDIRIATIDFGTERAA